jgi:hypothetical protein
MPPRKGKERSPTPAPVVFISHSSLDDYIAKKMRDDVMRTGATAFLDAVDIEIGDEISDRIQKGLERCTELVVLLTPQSIQRRWIWMEIGGAWSQKKRVSGIVHGMTIGDLLKEPDMPGVVQERNLTLLNDFPDYVRQLKRRVDRTTGR